jgi:hypothetical protein
MMEDRRKRILKKLELLADPTRNPDKEEVKAARRKIEDLQTKSPFLLQTIYRCEIEPPLWKKSLFAYICKTQSCKGIHTETAGGEHYLRAAGTKRDLDNTRSLFLWALSQIQKACWELPENFPGQALLDLQTFSARDLVSKLSCIYLDAENKAATRWLKKQIILNPEKEGNKK